MHVIAWKWAKEKLGRLFGKMLWHLLDSGLVSSGLGWKLHHVETLNRQSLGEQGVGNIPAVTTRVGARFDQQRCIHLWLVTKVPHPAMLQQYSSMRFLCPLCFPFCVVLDVIFRCWDNVRLNRLKSGLNCSWIQRTMWRKKGLKCCFFWFLY